MHYPPSIAALHLHPPHVPLLGAFWSLLDDVWGFLKGQLGVLAHLLKDAHLSRHVEGQTSP